MNKPYKNIITDKIVSFARYIILAEYETKKMQKIIYKMM